MSLKDIRSVDYIVLLCRKMKETRAFYQDVMGLPLDHDSDSWVASASARRC
jgi:catechol 2,3-dioxygenase-like lactoylglutathione lyase family enzyme